MAGTPESRNETTLWKFGLATLDEGARELRIDGEPQNLDAKTLDVLLLLLQHAGEVVTKEELFATVWAGRVTGDGVLTNAISRLRKLLQDDEQTLIVTLHRLGYRYAGPVARSAQSRAIPSSTLSPGDEVPTRPAWKLVERLGRADRDVWLARHAKTQEARVFKFASDGRGLAALKREVTIARVARAVLGERQDLAQILEWNFESAPFFIECAYGGADLLQWVERRGGLDRLDRETRLALFDRIASAVAAVHSAGILHKDLKPGNVLVWTDEQGRTQVRLADFGLGALLRDDEEISALGITRQGLTLDGAASDPASGTPLYLAPEVQAGQMPTTQADVYALGILLYQLCVGRFDARPSPGWESGIDDPLLCEDIAAAAHGDPAQRLASVDALLARLRHLDARRAERTQLATLQERARRAETALQRSRARRPVWIVAFVAVALGFATTAWQYRREKQARDDVEQQRAVAQATVEFIGRDLIGQANPQNHGTTAMTVAEAVDRAAAAIDRRLGGRPDVAAPLHAATGDLYGALGRYDAAQRELEAARDRYRGLPDPPADEIARLDLAAAVLDARRGEPERARQRLDRVAAADSGRLDAGLFAARQHCARSEIGQIAHDLKDAAAQSAPCVAGLRRALQARGREPALAGELALREAADVYLRLNLGEVEHAERDSRALRAALAADAPFGPDHPLTLAVQSTLGDSLTALGRLDEAIAELAPAAARLREQYGPQHMAYARSALLLADAYTAAGRYAEAIDLQAALVRIFDDDFGGHHPYALVAIQNLASTYDSAHRDRDSLAALEHGLTLAERNFGPDSPVEHRLRYDLADSALKLGDTALAAPHVARLQQDRLETITPRGNWTGRLELLRGRLALQQRDFAAAAGHLRAAITALQQRRDGHLLERAERFLARTQSADTTGEQPIWALEFPD